MYIFTECFNCAPIAKYALSSFHKHHDLQVYVYGTKKDFEQLGDIAKHNNTVLVEMDKPDILEQFKQGHRGTANIFAMAFMQYQLFGFNDYVVHFDSDVFFLRESISMMENAFNEGFDIVGSRRCYKNNPSGIKGLDNYPDSMSTYFLGMNTKKIPEYPYNRLVDMWQGKEHPLNYPILDFGDAVIHAAINNSATVKYLPQNLVGGQNEDGLKVSNYESNLHFDFGSNLIHFGGVGSGYAIASNISSPEKSYADWAVGRWSLFSKLFYNTTITNCFPTSYTHDGRWASGTFDNNILDTLLKDIGSETIEHFRWMADDAEKNRFNFNLNKNSIVIDAGGYRGDWAEKIYNLYKCRIHIFEPVWAFYNYIHQKFKKNNKISIYNKGVFDRDKDVFIYYNKDSTSIYKKEGEGELSKMCNLNDFIRDIGSVDLLKLNVEGAEYAVLKSMVEAGTHKSVKNILVQFHKIGEHHLSQKEAITNELKKTHHLTFCYEMIWENWELN